MSQSTASIWTKLPKPAQRRMAWWLSKRVRQGKSKSPTVSFTFDDFPRSALANGGAILRERGLVGTYFTSLGLMGTTIATGKMFVQDDLHELVGQGHELACHTFDHCDSWDTPPREFEAAILRNQKTLAELLPRISFFSHSYPISWPRPETKRRVAVHYECARGGGQTFNVGRSDLNYLKAFFIEQSRDHFEEIRQTIEDNARLGGWLIFATHDVCDEPSRYGCTRQLFQKVVECSVKSGADILPVHSAFQKIFGKS